MTSAWETPERQALRASAARFTRAEVVPFLSAWEDAREVPRALHEKAAAAGLLAVGFPEEVGGSGGDQVDVAVITEAMIEAGASSGLVAALFTHGIALPHIVRSGDERLIEEYVRPTLAGRRIGALAVTEPGGGSDVAALTTTARRAGGEFGGYVVDGAKTFITSGVRADFVTAAVRTGADGAQGLSLVVVDRGLDGFTVEGPLSKMGWHCSDTAELTFDGVHVPADRVVGEVDGGFVQLMHQFAGERLALAVHAYATAQRALDLAVGYARERRTFGRPLIDRQLIRHKLVRMHRRTATARAYTRGVLERPVSGEDAVLDACLAKNAAVEACGEVVEDAVQIFGGAGYMRESEVERHYRDARILGIGGGATEVLDDLAARMLGYVSTEGAR